jgi:hypothetical protein
MTIHKSTSPQLIDKVIHTNKKLKNTFQRANAGSPSESLKDLLPQEATNQESKEGGEITKKSAPQDSKPFKFTSIDEYMRASVLETSPKLLPEDKSYQHLSGLKKQYRDLTTEIWPKTPLKGRKVVILGGLVKDTRILNKLFNKSSEVHMNGLNKMHKDLLGNVTKELKMLVGNIDLETDQFASKEVEVVQELFETLESTQAKLQKHGLGQSKKDMNEAKILLNQLNGKYKKQ